MPNSNFTGSLLAYKAYFDLKSQEEDFKQDTYFFKITYPDLDSHTLFELGKIVKKDSINYVEPVSYFEDNSFCEMHLQLSRYKRIFIVTDFPR
ncbi:hypothetical protein N7U66_10545 [Lacinutrix neustonica]|uniref:Uncharacterized protein n=1 Tax=Lacinutrix neustonica TaxID=2980107 RepID=A0A9E8N0Y0_9FLAO|nr:hypothetical protein [Lacinutrix neustonica]WAC03810.1 hypothetical protein N7U66_10545 [Lacinutrix neustonica]